MALLVIELEQMYLVTLLERISGETFPLGQLIFQLDIYYYVPT